MAFNMPINDAIDRVRASAVELDAAAEKVRGKRDNFGEQLTAAVKRKVAERQPRKVAKHPMPEHITADADDQTFAEKLTNAVQKKLGQRARRVI